MRKLLLALTLLCFASPALAQNTQCSNRPTGDSSNACANTRFVGTAVAPGPAPAGRIQLSAPLTLYVNPSSTTAALCNGSSGGAGSDTTGTGTLALPFQTGNKALDTAARNYDVRLSQITIQYCDNNVTGAVYTTYNQQFNLVGAVSAGNAASAQLVIKGNSSTPANVIVQGAATISAFTLVGVTSPVLVADMQIGSTLIGGATTGHGIQSDAHSMVYYSNITWGFINTSYSHMVATYDSFIEQEGVERIIGGAALHWFGDRASQLLTTGNTITCTGAPAFGSAFVGIFNGSNFNLSGAAFSGCGAVTGPKYLADYTSSFGVGTADPNTIYPGVSVAATSVTLPSFGMTGIVLGNGGPMTGASQMTAMTAMSGDCTLALGTGVITCTIPTTHLSGTLQAAQEPAHTGDCTNSAGSLALACNNTAWTAFTPTPTCGTATITSASARARTLGKTTWIQGDFTITALGTCAVTNISFNLPNTAQSAGNLHGREGANTNVGINCLILASGTVGLCLKDNGLTWAVNDHIQFSGVYENQ